MMTSSAFRSRSYKIKEPQGVDDSLDNNEPTGGHSNKSTCDSPSSTRVSWKTSKIFSRTLSSIEVIRAMKSNKQNNNSSNNTHNQPLPPPISPTRPSVIVTATGDSAISTTLAPIIKGSSRHHHHEVNPYLIKEDSSSSSSLGHETTSGMVRTRSGNSKAASEWKVLKNKLSSLRKRSTGSSSGGGGDESSTTSISPGPGDEGEGSGRRLSSNSRTGSARTSRSGSQDEGIVCKREDLISLLTEATKVASSVSPPATTSPTSVTTSPPFNSSSSPSSTSPSSTGTSTIKPSIIKSDPPSVNVSPTSIGPRKVTLKTSSISSNTVQLQDQQSIDPTRKLVKKSALKKNPSTDSNNNLSNNNLNNSRANSSVDGIINDSVGFIETRIVVPTKPSLKFDLSHETRHEPRNRSVRGIQFKDNLDANNNTPNSGDQNASTVQVTSSPPIGTTTATESDIDKKVSTESTDTQNNSESPSSSSVAAVKWDESNVVDAMMLGDAIQAFLKGMEAASVQKPPEKRVLFKKQT